MVNINKEKYIIVCNVSGLTYYDSTCEPTLARRLHQHKLAFQNHKCKPLCLSHKVLENDSYGIFLVENFPCNNKDELRTRERFYVENMDCVNKCMPIRFEGEQSIWFKEYYENNKQKLLDNHKTYYSEHKSEISEYQKQYRQQNKEKSNEYKKHYNEKKKLQMFYLNFLRCFNV